MGGHYDFIAWEGLLCHLKAYLVSFRRIYGIIGTKALDKVLILPSLRLTVPFFRGLHFLQDLLSVAIFSTNESLFGLLWVGYIVYTCLLYTSDAADEEDSVDLGGRRIIK